MNTNGDIVSFEALEKIRAHALGTKPKERAEADMRRWTELTETEAQKLQGMNRHDRRAELARMRRAETTGKATR